MTWRDQAMCRDTDPDIFFPRVRRAGSNGKRAGELADHIAAAKRICATCPVDLECLDYALQTQTYNCKHHNCILGGLTYRERVNVLNARVNA